MLKQYAKYMKHGKEVEGVWTGEVYKLIEDVDENAGTVKAVSMENWRRYELLGAWIQNWERDSGFRERFTGDIEDCKRFRKIYETELCVADVKPHNTIRFITPDYVTKFEVKDLSQVRVNGERRLVIYIDSCHFALQGGCCFHICEFAELCERNGISVEPVPA